VRIGPRAARTILLFHIISARPSEQPRMVRTFLKVYTRLTLANPLHVRLLNRVPTNNTSFKVATKVGNMSSGT
jgi:hypothetical protein